ncbi:transcriptional repressor [Gilvimarinus agarilyticus]|uniref:Fur family transcriptional regulator n=1 Tax=unclassified Gilvimarinus TaxID=2642066 RepID=UPI001C0A1BBF|nr:MULTISPECIES: Fur family transcriptional regulator [unclassified Gilvimarinus]MBU2884309.1 transcriptional repressor [Gilvimarinus agarilyticus]MDO6569448.1 Fur family transcriptional regulator [Gilvimarinus sp. 2_MG-2023]MDO6747605.1 Fur family transcriptional regulator [Gilvimarinus sp. 1_MG-2023]
MSKAPLAFSRHNHQHCVSGALQAAITLCQERGVRLTPLRKQVLELIWQSHKPLGAYALLDLLSAEAPKPVAPPTVYRALDFLLEQKLIHRIGALNAFIGCPHPDHQHASHFLLCDDCGRAEEIQSPEVSDSINQAAQGAGFNVHSQSLEVFGLCPDCRAQSDSNG